ncbi:MAG: amidase [Clostridiales bacterium GWF2_36_10]|nr:MAG: amidase [Clostridiales bacterium GWF2_36_10]
MPVINTYNRQKAVDYAEKWAMRRNPKYLDFSGLGGDCTNFISQCIYAGCNKMNYTPVYGWFYINSNKRTASWTGVNFLYNFLINNKTKGPYAIETDVSKIELGDIVQLGDITGRFYHSLIVTKIEGQPSIETIYISTHTMDFYNRLLNTYIFDKIRFLHIKGIL